MSPEIATAMLIELRAIRQLLEGTRKPTLRRADRVILARVLPVLAAAFGNDIWTVNEAFGHASFDLRLVLDGISAKGLGRLLKRAINQDVDGLTVTVEGEESGARLWCLKRSS